MNALSDPIETHMLRDPVLIAPDDPLDLVETVLRSSHSRQWPVVRDHALVGIVSLRDLLTVRSLEGDRRHRERGLRVEHVMTRPWLVAHPDESLASAAELMSRYRLSTLPVMDGESLLGVVTSTHLVEVAVESLEAATRGGEPVRVERVMTFPPIRTAEWLCDVEFAAAIMAEFHVRHLPIVEGDTLVGIVSDEDLLEALHSGEDPKAILVQEIMTRSPLTTAPDADAAEAAKLMLREGVGALPVLEAGAVGGIVSKADFLGYLARASAR